MKIDLAPSKGQQQQLNKHNLHSSSRMRTHVDTLDATN